MKFQDVVAISAKMVEVDKDRDSMFGDLEDIYKMKWDNKPTDAQVRAAIAPDPHNTVEGIVDLLVGVKPEITVPYLKDAPSAKERSSKIEKCLLTMNNRAQRLRGSSVEMDACRAAAVFGMCSFKLGCPAETAEALEKGKADKHQITFYKDLAKDAPFVVDVIPSNAIHSERGPEGLRRVLEVRTKYVSDIWAEWGEKVLGERGAHDEVTYYEYWDRTGYCKWIEGEAKPLQEGEHDLPFIPYVIGNTHGTSIFGRTEYFPLLYSTWKGEIWESLNLCLTLMRSNTYALANPTLLAVGSSAWDADVPANLAGGMVNLAEGHSLSFLAKDLDIAAIQSLYNIFRQLFDEATVSKLIFGKAPEHVLAYSTVNLLIQGARHTLMKIIEGLSNALGELYIKQLQWMVHRKMDLELHGDGYDMTLSVAEIEEHPIEVQVKLKPDIPQDRLQIANMAKMLVEMKLMSRDTAIGMSGNTQPEDELEKIAEEQFVDTVLATKLQEIVQAMQPPQEGMPQQPPMGPPEMGPPEMGLPATGPPGEIPIEPGYAPGAGNIPSVQTTGVPTPAFQQAAAENMSELE